MDPGVQHPHPTPLVEVLIARRDGETAAAAGPRLVVVVVVVVEAEDAGEQRSSTLVDVELRLEVTHSTVDDQGRPGAVRAVVRPDRHQLRSIDVALCTCTTTSDLI